MVARGSAVHTGKGLGRADPRGVPAAPSARSRWSRPARRQRGPDGHRVRRHRHRLRAVRRVALHLGPDRAWPSGPSSSSAPTATPSGSSCSSPWCSSPTRSPPSSAIRNGGGRRATPCWPHFRASKSFLLLAVALIGTTITPYMQLYVAAAVVDKGVDPTSTATSGSTPSAGRSCPTSSPSSSSSPRRRDRGHRTVHLGGRRPPGPTPVAGVGAPRPLRARPARRVGPGGGGRSPLSTPTRSPRRSGSSGRCRRASARRRSSRALHRAAGDRRRRSSWCPAT